jgi:hypothetical protein
LAFHGLVPVFKVPTGEEGDYAVFVYNYAGACHDAEILSRHRQAV